MLPRSVSGLLTLDRRIPEWLENEAEVSLVSASAGRRGSRLQIGSIFTNNGECEHTADVCLIKTTDNRCGKQEKAVGKIKRVVDIIQQ